MNEQLFTGKVEYYEESRPQVAAAAVEYLCSLVNSEAVFADIGAGTGKFTSLIAEKGKKIYAVEPNKEMFSVLSKKMKRYSNVKLLCSSAENTKIPSNSIDVVVVVTALHWFDLGAFRSECARMLKPNGRVAVIYNSRKEELKKNNADYLNKTATQIFFDSQYDVIEFPNTQYYSYEKFIAYHLSHTTAPKPEDEGYASYIKELEAVFEQENVDGLYCFNFVSALYLDRNMFNCC